MKINVKKPNEYTRELSVNIPWQELERDFKVSLSQFSKKVKLPGFRSGKIPKQRLLNQFQKNIEIDFMDTNLQKYYLLAIQKENLTPVNKAEIKEVNFQMNNPFTFIATFEVEPPLILPKLKGNSLQVQKNKYIHDEQDIEDAITQLRKSHATIKNIDDAAIEGDYLICTLQKLDQSGVPVIGKKFENQYLRIGRGSFTDSQKDKMIGLKRGEKTRLKLPIGQDNIETEYEIVVENIEREILPELEPEFFKKINPGIDSVEAFKEDVDMKIKENFRERSKTSYERALSDALIEYVSPSFAPSMVEHYLSNLVEDVKKQNKGEQIEDEKIREHYLPIAERNIKWYTIRNKLIETQKLKVSSEELEKEIQRLIEITPKSEKEIKKYYKKPSNLKRLEDDLLEKIILEYIEQFAKVKEVEIQTKDLRKQEQTNG